MLQCVVVCFRVLQSVPSLPLVRLTICVVVHCERWGAGVETPKNVRGEIEGWGRVPFNEPHAPLLSTIYDRA